MLADSESKRVSLHRLCIVIEEILTSGFYRCLLRNVTNSKVVCLQQIIYQIMRLTGESQVSVDVAVNRQCVVVK